MKFVFLLILAFMTSAHAGEVVQLADARSEAALEHFTGNYLFGTRMGNDNAMIVIEEGRLVFWYACGNIPSSSFNFNLEDFNKRTERPYRGARGRGTEVIDIRLIDGSLYKDSIVTIGRHRSIEHFEIRIKGAELTMIHTREFYRRLPFSSTWKKTLKPSPPDSAQSILNYKQVMLRVSDKPMGTDAYFAMIRSRPSQYIVLRTSEATSADTLREQIEKGNYDIITDEDIKERTRPKPQAQIIQLRTNCETELAPTTEPQPTLSNEE